MSFILFDATTSSNLWRSTIYGVCRAYSMFVFSHRVKRRSARAKHFPWLWNGVIVACLFRAPVLAARSILFVFWRVLALEARTPSVVAGLGDGGWKL